MPQSVVETCPWCKRPMEAAKVPCAWGTINQLRAFLEDPENDEICKAAIRKMTDED